MEAVDVRHIEHEDRDQQDGDGYADHDDVCDESDSAAGEEVYVFLLLICGFVLEAE